MYPSMCRIQNENINLIMNHVTLFAFFTIYNQNFIVCYELFLLSLFRFTRPAVQIDPVLLPWGYSPPLVFNNSSRESLCLDFETESDDNHTLDNDDRAPNTNTIKFKVTSLYQFKMKKEWVLVLLKNSTHESLSTILWSRLTVIKIVQWRFDWDLNHLIILVAEVKSPWWKLDHTQTHTSSS